MKKRIPGIVTALLFLLLGLVPMAGAAAAGDHQLLLGGDCSIVDMVNGGYGASGEYAADVDGGFTFWRAAGAEYKGDGSIFYRLESAGLRPGGAVVHIRAGGGCALCLLLHGRVR